MTKIKECEPRRIERGYQTEPKVVSIKRDGPLKVPRRKSHLMKRTKRQAVSHDLPPPNGSALSCERADCDGTQPNTPPGCKSRWRATRALAAVPRNYWRSSAAAPW
jgi:hypothetical protein